MRQRRDDRRVSIVDGRIVTPAHGRVQVWTIIRPATWDALCSASVLYVDPAHILYEEYMPQYEWVRGQMARRIPGYSGHFPWWAWALPKPDLRSTEYHWGPSGAPLLRLGLAVPATEILCMDYDLWHIPLNEGYLSLSCEEDTAWEQLPEAGRTRTALERSWERLFDHTLAFDPDWIGTTRTVQAIFEVLRLGDVTEVTPFRSRASARRTWHPALIPRIGP